MLAKIDGEKACVDHDTVMRRVVATEENFILIVCGPIILHTFCVQCL